MTVSEPAALGEKLTVERLAYPSPMTSVDPEKNDTVRARLFRTEKPADAAVIVLGGWRNDPVTPTLGAKLAQESDLQVLYIELPFQGERTPKGRRSGELTFSSDLVQNEATFLQAAQDVGRAVDWLVRERKIDPKRIGILGTSLGGYVAADLYGMDDRFAAAVIQISGGDIATVVFNGNFLTKRLRDQFVAKGIEEQTVRETMRPLDPTTWARKERKDGLLLIAAEKDEVVELPTVKKLAEAYGGAKLVVIPDAHHIDPAKLQENFGEAVSHFKAKLLPKAAATPSAPPAPAPAPAPATK
jgi:dienelactone hydrolase